MALEAPPAPEDIRQEGFAAAAGLAIGAVVGSHDRLHAGVHDAGLKGGEIGFLQVLGRYFGVEAVAEVLRAAVNGEVLGAGGGLHHIACPL